MAAILRAGGLRVTVGHYAIRLEDCERLKIQCYGGDLGDPQIEAEAATLESLLHDASRVSAALAAADLRHRFELYVEGGSEMAAYLHHRWPPDEASAGGQQPCSPEPIQRLLAAFQRFKETGVSDSPCDACGDAITFRAVNDQVWQSECRCGKYDEVLRGI